MGIVNDINTLKQKYNVRFDLISEEEAKDFVLNNNYWTKLVRYVHCFNEHASGKFEGMPANLDFCYLRDLSSIDMYFRKNLLSLSLDLEHGLKTKLLNHMANNPHFDQKKYMSELRKSFKNQFRSMLKNANASFYSKEIANKYRSERKKQFSTIVELFSFGELVNATKMYKKMYPDFINDFEFSLLYNSKMLRNAAAHNNAILTDLNPTYRKAVTDKQTVDRLCNVPGFPKRLKEKARNYQLLVDFISLLRVSLLFCSTPLIIKRKEDFLQLFQNRCFANISYYDKHEHIKVFFEDMEKAIDFLLDIRV